MKKLINLVKFTYDLMYGYGIIGALELATIGALFVGGLYVFSLLGALFI